jgi:MFS family permease
MTADAYAARLLSETRDELTRADSKANILLAASGVAIGAVLSGVIAASLNPTDLDGRVQWVFWSGVVLAAGGITALGSAVWPRVGKACVGRADYFLDVAQYESVRELEQAIRGTEQLARDTRQLHALAVSARTKYRLTRVGVALVGLGIVACSASALLHFLVTR